MGKKSDKKPKNCPVIGVLSQVFRFFVAKLLDNFILVSLELEKG